MLISLRLRLSLRSQTNLKKKNTYKSITRKFLLSEIFVINFLLNIFIVKFPAMHNYSFLRDRRVLFLYFLYRELVYLSRFVPSLRRRQIPSISSPTLLAFSRGTRYITVIQTRFDTSYLASIGYHHEEIIAYYFGTWWCNLNVDSAHWISKMFISVNVRCITMLFKDYIYI